MLLSGIVTLMGCGTTLRPIPHDEAAALLSPTKLQWVRDMCSPEYVDEARGIRVYRINFHSDDSSGARQWMAVVACDFASYELVLILDQSDGRIVRYRLLNRSRLLK